MPIQQWSEDILVVNLGGDSQFSDEVDALRSRLDASGVVHVVLNLEPITYINSSNISALLRLRQRLVNGGKDMRLCCLPQSVCDLLRTMGLDKFFETAPDVSGALASLQLDS